MSKWPKRIRNLLAFLWIFSTSILVIIIYIAAGFSPNHVVYLDADSWGEYWLEVVMLAAFFGAFLLWFFGERVHDKL